MSLAVPDVSLPPLPRVKGVSHRPKGASRCTPPDVLHQFPGAWSQETGRCRRHRAHPGMQHL
eukprot:5018008-Pyramimonas_sp.AAC.1